MALTLLKSTSMRLTLSGLVDINGDPVTNATVTATIFDRTGQDEIGGTSWPITLAHDSGGDYFNTLDYDLDIRIGKRYVVEIIAVSGSLQSTWQEDCICEYADDD